MGRFVELAGTVRVALAPAEAFELFTPAASGAGQRAGIHRSRLRPRMRQRPEPCSGPATIA